MNIYIAINNPYKNQNPFVRTLIDGIKHLHPDAHIAYGLELLWREECLNYDIIHIQWPEVFAFNATYLNNLADRLVFLKNKGKIIISTCHNINCHFRRKANRDAAYPIVYGISDYMIHLGNYSLELMKNLYPNAKHVLIPHHVYDHIYKLPLPKKDCANILKINSKKNYILCLGDFRNKKERELVIKMSYMLPPNYSVLAPSFSKIQKRRNLFYLIKPLCIYLYYKLKYPKIKNLGRFVTDEEIPQLFGVADFCFIQRINGINSGNVPMSFLMGKVVVGPSIGNIKEILEETGNPIFDPYVEESIRIAIQKGIYLSSQNKGFNNREYALHQLSTYTICEKIYKLYQKAIQ